MGNWFSNEPSNDHVNVNTNSEYASPVFTPSPYSSFTPQPTPSYRPPAYTSPYVNHGATANSYLHETSDYAGGYGSSYRPEAAQKKTREKFILTVSENYTSLKNAILEEYNATEFDISGVLRKTLDKADAEYHRAKRSFDRTTHAHTVLKIEKVYNPFLMAFYILRQEEYSIIYDNAEEDLWFHGTKVDNISGIINNNFNWRMHGKTKGNIFGKGVSFSPISYYSSNYSDEAPIKVMILAKVLSCNSCVGNVNMIIPPYFDDETKTRYDTSKKADGKVCVKYCDDEFYPLYIIYYRRKM